MPQLQCVHYWQDNAGSYHCGNTIAFAQMVGQQHGVTVKRMDFCDPQGGKGACDRKSAAIKSHMKVYLNSGSNIETTDEMKEAILSSGGMSSVRATSCGPPNATANSNIKLEGVSSIFKCTVRRQRVARLESLRNWTRKTNSLGETGRSREFRMSMLN